MKSKATSRISVVILILGLMAIGVAGYFAYSYFSPMKTTVYVFNNDYEAGTPITKDMLTNMQVDTKIVSAAKSGNVSMQYVTTDGLQTVLNSKDSLLVNVTKGTTLMPWLLNTNGGGAIESNLESDTIAVTVPMDSYSAVTDDLRVGAHLNIYSTSSYGESKTYLLLEDMTVIGIMRGNGSAISGLTFACTHEQALQLLHARTYESLYCGLIDESGYVHVLEGESNKKELESNEGKLQNSSALDPVYGNNPPEGDGKDTNSSSAPAATPVPSNAPSATPVVTASPTPVA